MKKYRSYYWFILLAFLSLTGINSYSQADNTRLINTQELMKSIFGQDEIAAISWLNKGVLIDGEGLDMNPLINAIYYKMPHLITELIEKGANVEAQNKDGTTPLMAAAIMADLHTMALLFDKNADPFRQNKKGYNSFDFSIFSQSFEGERTLLFLYLKTIKEPSTAYLNQLKYALLLQALLSEDANYYFQLLEQLEVRLEDTFFTNMSPLDISLMNEKGAFVKGLLKRGFPVSELNKLGKLPIQFVSPNRQKETYLLLLKKMLEEQAATREEKIIVTQLGSSPSIKAGKLKHLSLDFQKLLMEYAIITDYKGTVVELLKRGMDVNGQNNQGLYFLSIAVQVKNIDIAKILLENGAHLYAQNDNTYRTTAFMEATSANDIEMGKLLLARGARINFGDINNDPALNYAVYYGHFDFVKFLLEHKADFTMKGQGGYTALMTAKAHDYKKIIELLKAYGAKE